MKRKISGEWISSAAAAANVGLEEDIGVCGRYRCFLLSLLAVGEHSQARGWIDRRRGEQQEAITLTSWFLCDNIVIIIYGKLRISVCSHIGTAGRSFFVHKRFYVLYHRYFLVHYK